MNLAEFRNVWQNTPSTVCHPAMACLPHWCCWTVLSDDVIQHNFLQCNFTCLCAWALEGFFPWGTSGFFQKFSRGSESGEICFLPLETKKTAFFAEILKSLPSFRHPSLCVGKSSCHTIKIGVIWSKGVCKGGFLGLTSAPWAWCFAKTYYLRKGD